MKTTEISEASEISETSFEENDGEKEANICSQNKGGADTALPPTAEPNAESDTERAVQCGAVRSGASEKSEEAGESEAFETAALSESGEACGIEATTETADVQRVGGQENGAFSEDVFGKLYELVARFPTEKAAEDVASEAFRRFAAGKSGDVLSIYADYLDFKRAFSAQSAEADYVPAVSVEAEEERFSAYAGGAALPDHAQSLTSRQMQIARESGMSYREYAELLQSVPAGRKRF